MCMGVEEEILAPLHHTLQHGHQALQSLNTHALLGQTTDEISKETVRETH